MSPVYGCVLLQKPLLNHIKKIKWDKNRINNFVKDETILCPGYNVIYIFGFVQTLFRRPIMIAFVSRNLISTPKKYVALTKEEIIVSRMEPFSVPVTK